MNYCSLILALLIFHPAMSQASAKKHKIKSKSHRYIFSGGSRKFCWGEILSSNPQKFGCLHRNWEWFLGRNRKFERFFHPDQVVSKKKKKKKKKGLQRNWKCFFGRNRKFEPFFRPKSGGLQNKKKTKVFTEIESDFSAETVSFTLVGGGCISKWSLIFRNRGWFFGRNRYF